MKSKKRKIFIAVSIHFLMFSVSCYSKTDLSLVRKEIDSIIISIIKKDNFDKHVTFNNYRSDCSLWTGKKYKGSATFQKDIIQFKPNQYHLWYDLDLVDGNFLDDRIMVYINIKNNKREIVIKEIPQCFMDTFHCEKFIPISEAKDIAKENGLEKGLLDWRVNFRWQSQESEILKNDKVKITLVKGFYYWSVANVLVISTPEPCMNGDGIEFKINPISGAVISKEETSFGCMN